MKIAFFVPIKMNSTRLQNKMTLPLGNYIFCQHIFNTLVELKEKLKDINHSIDIYCFCSDKKIKKLLRDEVIYINRSPELDSDDTKGIDIYLEFIKKVEADIYGLVHATSPFLKSENIMKGLIPVINGTNDSSFSVSKIQTFCWFNGTPLNYDFNNVIQTQKITPIYYETSAFYIFKKEILTIHKRRIGFNPLQIETNRIESIDVDEKEDYELCQAIMNT